MTKTTGLDENQRKNVKTFYTVLCAFTALTLLTLTVGFLRTFIQYVPEIKRMKVFSVNSYLTWVSFVAFWLLVAAIALNILSYFKSNKPITIAAVALDAAIVLFFVVVLFLGHAKFPGAAEDSYFIGSGWGKKYNPIIAVQSALHVSALICIAIIGIAPIAKLAFWGNRAKIEDADFKDK